MPFPLLPSQFGNSGSYFGDQWRHRNGWLDWRCYAPCWDVRSAGHLPPAKTAGVLHVTCSAPPGLHTRLALMLLATCLVPFRWQRECDSQTPPSPPPPPTTRFHHTTPHEWRSRRHSRMHHSPCIICRLPSNTMARITSHSVASDALPAPVRSFGRSTAEAAAYSTSLAGWLFCRCRLLCR